MNLGLFVLLILIALNNELNTINTLYNSETSLNCMSSFNDHFTVISVFSLYQLTDEVQCLAGWTNDQEPCSQGSCPGWGHHNVFLGKTLSLLRLYLSTCGETDIPFTLSKITSLLSQNYSRNPTLCQLFFRVLYETAISDFLKQFCYSNFHFKGAFVWDIPE